MRKPTRRDVGRGERVVPGVWRLRLPLPWPGVPHCNAWALASGDGIVLVDTGMNEAGSMGHLERALEQVGLRIDLVRLIVLTHAHVDHCGQAPPIAARAGCEVWLHPRHEHHTRLMAHPEQAIAARLEVARQSGVPEDALRRWAAEGRALGSGQAGELHADRDLLPGITVPSDLGPWEVVHTPGHAPSHVCLHQRERRILLSGDHLLGRVSLYFDHGTTPDPVGEFLESLDTVEALDARLCLAGHGRPFTDVEAHVNATRALVAERLDAVRALLAGGTTTAWELAARLYGDLFTEATASWLLAKTLAWLDHLEARGDAVRHAPASATEAWSAP